MRNKISVPMLSDLPAAEFQRLADGELIGSKANDGDSSPDKVRWLADGIC